MTEPPLFDPATLDPEALAFWEESDGTSEPIPMTVFDLRTFAYVCMLELGRVPEPVKQRIDELDPENMVGQYMQAFRASIDAKRRGAVD